MNQREKFIVAANWKMNKTPSETREFLREFAEKDPRSNLAKGSSNVEVVIFPPYTSLHVFCEPNLSSVLNSVQWGAQDCASNSSGAFTGEVSPLFLKELEVSHVILGHSERRTLFGETNKTIAAKAKLAQEVGLTTIVCIGETLEEREAGQTWKVLETQLRESLAQLFSDRLVLAYEPVWAIGTGKTATLSQVQEAHQKITNWLNHHFRLNHHFKGASIPVLYGGSVKPDNANQLAQCAEVGGFLVGGASLTPSGLSEILAASLI